MQLRHHFVVVCELAILSACTVGSEPELGTGTQVAALSGYQLDTAVRAVIDANHLTGDPGARITPPEPALVGLGTALFFDKILGGEQNQACASCHHPQTATGDDLRLSRGVGSSGVGKARELGAGPIIPRNAPPVWNGILFDTQFWDGRVARTADGVIHSPDGVTTDVTTALAAQAEFPVTSDAEMRGSFLPDASNQELRAALAARVATIPAYTAWFGQVFGDPAVTYARIATAMGAYEASLMPVNTPWFAYVRGDRYAISSQAKRGALIFYGRGGCARCHSGDMLTDLDFHNIGLPQFGPGKGNGPDGGDDFGRELVTGDPSDRYKFRTPTLVNVTLHGPFGHDGAYQQLEDIVRHHLDPIEALEHYRNDNGTLESVFRTTLRDTAPLLATLDPGLADSRHLTREEIMDLMAFLAAQTDPNAMADAAATTPTEVPSGLPIDE